MKLVVHELEAAAIEQVVIPTKNTIVEAIRPHLLRYDWPAGTLKLQIHDSVAALVAESEVIDIEDLGDATYAHGYYRFYIDAYLKKDEPYTISLVSGGGYTFDEAAWIGWVNGHDLAKYPITTEPDSSYHYPLDFEIWERRP